MSNRKDRKNLFIICCALIISVLTLTMAYATLSVTLNIEGTAKVQGARWDIHFDNIKLLENSVQPVKTPTIISSDSINFEVVLNKPGDFLKFTVDVVNSGTIDAMIDSIVKLPELTENEKKIINYEIKHTNGNELINKEILNQGNKFPLIIILEYRKDINIESLPTKPIDLDLSFKGIFTQKDDTGIVGPSIPNVLEIKPIVGTGLNVSDEIRIGTEEFYVMKDANNTDTITMMAKYNLFVGGVFDYKEHIWEVEYWTPYGNEVTNMQDPRMLGYQEGVRFWHGGTPFATTEEHGVEIADYKGSTVERYNNKYGEILKSMGTPLLEIRLANRRDLDSLGCRTRYNECDYALEWVTTTSYWISDKRGPNEPWRVISNKFVGVDDHYFDCTRGVRPVITIPKSALMK